jgi:dTDP-4-amino-4,6-dideoxygalactose transaminase
LRKDFLVFGAPQIQQPEIDAVVRVLESGWLGTGPRVAEFEKDFAAYKRASHAVAVSSCTAALHLSLLAAGIGPGDEVITTAMTFCATVNTIIHTGATPVLADIDPLSLNLDPRAVEAAVTERTRAIIPVHFAGRPCDMDAISAIAERHGLMVIEDCAHAVETEYKNKPAGTIGDFGCFSFYVTKNVATGEGGMVLTAAAEQAEHVRTLSLHGMSNDAWKRFGSEGFKHYEVVEAGFKYNMMDLQAAIGIQQLRRVEANWVRRGEIWGQYDEYFRDLPITRPAKVEPWARHARHLYTIFVNEARTGISRNAFLEFLTSRKIGAGVHYLSIPEHGYYRFRFGWRPEDYPHAMQAGREILSLPLSAVTSDADVADVVDAVGKAVESGCSAHS